MLGAMILSLSFFFVFADAMTNNLIMPGTSTVLPLSANYGIPKIMPPNQDIEVNQDNIKLHDCPNTAILLNILNIMTKLSPKDDKNMFEPDKFKHVLTIVKNFVETTPFNSHNMDNQLKNIEKQLDEINVLKSKIGLRKSINENSKSQVPIQYTSLQQNQNCLEIFNNLVKLINSAYYQVIRYCAATERCNISNENIFNVYSRIHPFNVDASEQPNFAPNTQNQEALKYLASMRNKLTEHNIAGSDLINFMKNHEGKDTNNIMTILQNHKPGKIVDVSNPSLQIDPQKVFIYNVTPPLVPHAEKPSYDVNGQLAMQFDNKSPHINTIPWQNMFSGLKGLPGNTYENQHNVKLLEQTLYGSNNLGLPSSTYPNPETHIILNRKIVPIKTPTIESKQDNKPSILNDPNFKPNEINTNPNVLNGYLKLFLNNQQQNLLSTTTNLSPVQPEVGTAYSKDISSILQSKLNLQNVLIPNNYPNVNTVLHKQIVQKIPHNVQQSNLLTLDPQKYLNQIQFLYGHPILGTNNQLLNPNVLDLNKLYGFPNHNPKHKVDTVNTFSDNNKQGNYANQLLDLNQLLSVTNLAKLNTVPNKNGIVELTYVLKRPKPVYDSEYYVKYRLPYQTFVYNLQNLLIKKPQLRNEPNQLYQVLLVGSNVSDTSNDLKTLNYDQIINLTSANGTLVTAKLLESHDNVFDNTLRLVQKLNSNIPLENIINFNATKNIRMDIKEDQSNGSQYSSVMNTFMKNIYPQINTQRQGLYQYLHYPLNTLEQYNSGLNYYPYSVYQANPTIYTAPLKYGYNSIKTNAQLPLVYSQSVAKSYPQLLNYYGK